MNQSCRNIRLIQFIYWIQCYCMVFFRFELYFICDSSSVSTLPSPLCSATTFFVWCIKRASFFRMWWFVLSIRLLHSSLDTWGLQLAINIYGKKYYYFCLRLHTRKLFASYFPSATQQMPENSADDTKKGKIWR